MKKEKTIRIASIRIPLSAVHSAEEEQAVLRQKIAAACGIAPGAVAYGCGGDDTFVYSGCQMPGIICNL